MQEDKLKNLFQIALNALNNAYAPYSNHPVGCAIETEEGDVFSGCNVETANYDGTCAETGAITAMNLAGHRKIKTVVVVGPGEHLCTPCGRCRQRIREFQGENTFVSVFNRKGQLLKTYTVEQLLPDSFGPENLKL